MLRAIEKEELQPDQVKKDAGAVADRAQGGQPLNQEDSALSEVQQKLTATIGVIGPMKHDAEWIGLYDAARSEPPMLGSPD